MNKNVCYFGVLAAGLLASTAVAQAQQLGKPAPTAAALKRDLQRIDAYEYYYTPDLDIGGLVDKTARRLVAYLKTHEVSVAEAKKLGLGLSIQSRDAAHVKVFTYSYASGGTRGEVNCSVFQWKNQAGKLFAYSFGEKGGLDEIYKLPSPGRTQYLLLGSEQGSSICVRGIAWLVELKGNYLLLDKQAFDNKPVIDICNVELTYDARHQTLAVAGGSPFGTPDVYADKPFRPFKLYFSQGRFVKK